MLRVTRDKLEAGYIQAALLASPSLEFVPRGYDKLRIHLVVLQDRGRLTLFDHKVDHEPHDTSMIRKMPANTWSPRYSNAREQETELEYMPVGASRHNGTTDLQLEGAQTGVSKLAATTWRRCQ